MTRKMQLIMKTMKYDPGQYNRRSVMKTRFSGNVRQKDGAKTSTNVSETTTTAELPTENVDGSVVVVIQVYNLVAEINGRIL